MKRSYQITTTAVCLALGMSVSALCFAQTPPAGESPMALVSQDDIDLSHQGEYVGEASGVQVIALGKGQFRGLTFAGGLPGAGWNQTPPTSVEGNWEAMTPLVKGLEKVTRESPTLGQDPVEGAVILFDGSKQTFEKHWVAGAAMSADGLLQQGATTTDTFGDFTLHLEFRLPFMPEARGQARGNSGCYLQGRYETQILDSFGLKGADNECGGIYQAAAPLVNMCFPPTSWQTYDIDFTAARFDSANMKTANAKVTIKHNGVIIQQDLELPKQTPGGVLKTESKEPGPLFLQNHKDEVRFRNIWVIAR